MPARALSPSQMARFGPVRRVIVPKGSEYLITANHFNNRTFSTREKVLNAVELRLPFRLAKALKFRHPSEL